MDAWWSKRLFRELCVFVTILFTVNTVNTVNTVSAAGAGAVPEQGTIPALTNKPDGYVPTQVLVRFTKEAVTSTARIKSGKAMQGLAGFGKVGLKPIAQLRSNKVAAKQRSVLNRWRLIDLPKGVTVEQAITMFRGDGDVEYAEPNQRVAATTIPNDTYYGDLWGLDNTGQNGGTPDADIDAPEAWAIANNNGSVVVAVTDTGIDTNHPDLVNQLWVNPGEIAANGIDDDANGYIDDVYGYNFVANSGNVEDDYGHGSHVSGTIAATGNNNEGIIGVSDNARIMAVKFLDSSGYGTWADAMASVIYAIEMKADIINASWGGDTFSQGLYDAIEAANSAGILFVAAAGNSAVDMDITTHYPAGYDSNNIISVAATDRNDQMASFSNWGLTTVDLAAPGVGVKSTVPAGSHNCWPFFCSAIYLSYSGTSMAAPHVAGAAALLLANSPGLSATTLKSIILSSVDTPASLAGTTVTGGRLNLHEAMKRSSYALSVSPEVSVAQGATVNPTLNVDTFNTFNGPLTLSVVSSQPGLTVTLAGTSVNPTPGGSASVGMTVTADASLHAGYYDYTIYSTDQASVQLATTMVAHVVGPDFNLSLTPGTQTVTVPQSVTYNLTIDSIEGLTGPISLNAIMPEPTITTTFSNNPVTLTPNGSTTVDVTLQTDATTPFGDYNFQIEGSDGGVTYSKSAWLKVLRLVDFVAADVQSPWQVGQEGQFQVSFVVTNKGSSNAYPHYLFYLSTDQVLDASDVVISGGDYLIPAGESVLVESGASIPAGVSTGQYYVIAKIDSANLWNEPNEQDNTAVSSFIVEVVPSAADAIILDAFADKSSVSQGQNLTATAYVKNQGSTYMDNVEVDFYLSYDNTISSLDQWLGTVTLPTPLYAGETQSASITTMVQVATPGPNYLIAVVDKRNNIYETDDTNNTFIGDTVRVDTGADLIVDAFSAPSQGTSGGALAISITGKNQGINAVNSVWWALYLSTDPIIDSNDQMIFQPYWADSFLTLNPGQSTTRNKTIYLPSGLTPGQYYIGGIIDHWQSIVEIDETNNSSVAVPITIQ